ncbi:ABC transporter substrate-binding protein [Cryptosporangium japonicum]|uniref:Thiamine pyrimidine synthase n=1 Tax=Cryptosporangium japonicum TaxID=80872 RepID=A0ABP3E3I1_9ACTN
MKRHGTSRILAALLALLVTVTAACGGTDQDSGDGGRTTIRFGFNWVHDIEWASWYLAEKNGYFAKHDVDVELVPGGENTPAVSQLIAAGKVDLGVASDELQIINANKQGGDFVLIGAMYQRSPYGLTWLTTSGITKPADLVGKKIGGLQGEQPRLDAVFTANGLKPDYTFVPVSYDPQPLVKGDVDAITSYSTNQTISLGLRGVKTTAITFSDFGLPSYGDVLFASRSYLDEHGDAVAGFLAALKEGIAANVADPAAGVKTLVDTYGKDATIDEKYATAANPAYIALLDSDYTKAHGRLAIDETFLADRVFAGYRQAGEKDLPEVADFVDLSYLEKSA